MHVENAAKYILNMFLTFLNILNGIMLKNWQTTFDFIVGSICIDLSILCLFVETIFFHSTLATVRLHLNESVF